MQNILSFKLKNTTSGNVASITAGLIQMIDKLKDLIDEREIEIDQSRVVITAEQTKIETNRAEIEKAQNVIKNISALIEEKHE